MKRKHRSLSLLIAFALIICDITPVYGESYNGCDDLYDTFSGIYLENVSGNDDICDDYDKEARDIEQVFLENQKDDVTPNDALVETDESLFTWDGTIITGYIGEDTEIVIPAKATKIGDHAFEDSAITQVRFAGDGVTSIGKYAFYQSQLTDIYLPSGLLIIDDYAFALTLLQSVTIPQKVQKINEGAFLGSTIDYGINKSMGPLKEVNNLSENLLKIGDYAFYYQSVASFDFSEPIIAIGDSAFYHSGLKTLELPKSITSIGKTCFSYCEFDEVIMKCKSIQNNDDAQGPFWLASINKLSFSNDVVEIGAHLFSDVYFSDGIEVVIPESVSCIHECAFYSCHGNITFRFNGNGPLELGSSTFFDSEITSIVMPEYVTEIPWQAFANCICLSDIVFPDKLESIAYSAFSSCKSLEEIILPYGTKKIEEQAFSRCSELSIVYVPSTVDNIYNNSFEMCDVDFRLFVVENSYAHRYAVENNINYEFYDDGGTSLISVTYNLNGGENNYNNMDGYYVGDEVSLGYPYRNGYEFAGWYYDSKFESKVPASFTAEENITVYAKWKPIVYEIVYKLGAGKSNPNPTTYTIESDTIVLKNPVSDHGTFLGWYNGNGQKVTTIPKGSYGYIYLIARWQEAEYTISFSSNGGSGYMNSCTVSYSEEKTLPYCSFTKSGYYFKGWNTKADGKGKTYWNGETVSMLSSKKNGTVTLYAQWEIQTYYISYELNGGTQNSKNKNTYTIKTAVTLNNPTREGYTFKGWFNNSGLTGVKKTSIPKGSEGDVYLYANWEENHYKILYNINGKGATGTVPNAAVSFAEVVSLPDEEALTRPGYTLVGWNTKSNGKGENFEPGEGVSELVSKNNGSISLYAVWQAEQYDICYFNVDEADNSKNPDVYDTTKKISLKSPVMAGYTFKGWYENEGLNGNKISMIKAGNVGEKNFYASWSENKYKLAFNKNSGSLMGELPAVTEYMYTDTVSLPDEVATRNGYWLSGWNTKANGKGDHYDVGDCVSGICGTNNKKITLYAEWTPIQYDVYYELDGGENNPANLDYHTSVASMTLKNPTKVGYTFKGWYTTEDFKASSKVSKIAKSDQPVTVYAKWQVNTYKVSFNKNGGSGSMSTITAKYDETVNLPKGKFTRNGYVFAGWNTKANGTGDWYADEAEVVSLTEKNGKVVVLYAMWEKQ